MGDILGDRISEIDSAIEELLLTRFRGCNLQYTVNEWIVETLLVEESEDSELFVVLGLVNELQLKRECFSAHVVLRWSFDLHVNQLKDLVTPVEKRSSVWNQSNIVSSVSDKQESGSVLRCQEW